MMIPSSENNLLKQSVHFQPQWFWFQKQNAAKLYAQMYAIADKISLLELKRYEYSRLLRNRHETDADSIETFALLSDYRQERIEYHMERMFQLHSTQASSTRKDRKSEMVSAAQN
jgi:hypothetical protein